MLCRLPGFEILGITPPAAAIMTTFAVILLSIAARAGTVLLAAPLLPMPRGERAPMLAIPTWDAPCASAFSLAGPRPLAGSAAGDALPVATV